MLVLLLVASLIAGEPARIEGTVTSDGPLPGTTVRITSPAVARTTTSDGNGRFAFDALPPGTYDVTFELPGFVTVEKRVAVNGVEDVSTELRLEAVTAFFSCGIARCVDSPENEWDRPSCADFELDTALIEALEQGDASTRALLEHRFETTFTYEERHRIAAALLRRTVDDSRFWKELERHASIAIRFPRAGFDHSPDLIAWCAERNVDPEDYWGMALDALSAASTDSRSRSLLLRALETEDEALLDTAVWGLALQRDESVLPAIDAMLKRTEGTFSLIMALAAFDSDAADAVALKYLAEGERGAYAELRAEFAKGSEP